MAKRVVRDYTDSEKVNALSWMAEIVWSRLLQKADDFGFYHANPKLLKSFLFPLKDNITSEEIEEYLNECETVGLLYTYTVSEKKYLQIYNFGQRMRNMKTKFPQPADNCQQPADNCPPEIEIEREIEIRKGNRKELILPFDSENFILVWNKLLEERKWRNKSNTALQMALKKLSKHNESDAIKMIENSIEGEWQGLFELKDSEKNGTTKKGTQFERNADVTELGNAARNRLRNIENNNSAAGDSS